MSKRRVGRLIIECSNESRGNKVFVDYLRNSFGAPAVVLYAVRAYEKAPIATPVSWKELAHITTSKQYTIATIRHHLETTKNPWAAYACSARALKV